MANDLTGVAPKTNVVYIQEWRKEKAKSLLKALEEMSHYPPKEVSAQCKAYLRYV